MTAKIFEIDGLVNFLRYGVLLARAQEFHYKIQDFTRTPKQSSSDWHSIKVIYKLRFVSSFG